jgi:proteasome lid subunit RPN8/RPN11
VNSEQNLWTIKHKPWDRILGHTLADYPAEACGILLCPIEKPYHITEAHPTRNATSEDSTRRYLLDPLEILHVQKRAEQRGLEICGFYHSHPDNLPLPSECDRQSAWEGYLYLILSIKDGVFERLGGWYWDRRKEKFAEVIFQLRPPQKEYGRDFIYLNTYYPRSNFNELQTYSDAK